MEELKLPVIKEALPQAKWLPMDDYMEFVNLHLRYTLDREAYQRLKRLSSVNVRFLL